MPYTTPLPEAEQERPDYDEEEFQGWAPPKDMTITDVREAGF